MPTRSRASQEGIAEAYYGGTPQDLAKACCVDAG